MALAVAPMVGISLLLFAPSVAPEDVNLVCGIVYSCLGPYIAIALALTYFELASQRAERLRRAQSR